MPKSSCIDKLRTAIQAERLSGQINLDRDRALHEKMIAYLQGGPAPTAEELAQWPQVYRRLEVIRQLKMPSCRRESEQRHRNI